MEKNKKGVYIEKIGVESRSRNIKKIEIKGFFFSYIIKSLYFSW